MKAVTIFLITMFVALYAIPSFAELPPVDPKYGSKVNITFDNTYEITQNAKTSPAISPDGKTIAFVNQLKEGNFNESGIFLVPVEGGKASLLYLAKKQYKMQALDIWNIQFMPNGKEIYYTEAQGVPIDAPKYPIFFLKAVNIETKEVRVIVENAYNASFSSDGRYVSYINCDPKYYTDELQTEYNDIPTIYDTVTGEKRYLIEENISTGSWIYDYPTISQDLKWVYFHKQNYIDTETGTRKGQLFRMPFEGGNVEQVSFFNDVQGFTFCRNINFSPDGKWLVFDYASQILVYNLENKIFYDAFSGDIVVKPLGDTQDTGVEACPNWMPNGTSFVFNVRMGGRNYSRELLFNNYQEATEKDLFGSSIYICTFNAAKYATNPTVVESSLPSDYPVISNFPNPFNPSTTIEFNLTKPGPVNLSVYSLTGQKVCELASDDMGIGKHSYLWNGRDSKGIPVSSGIFFTRLETRDNVISNRMMLVK